MERPKLLIGTWTALLLAGLVSLSQAHEITEVISRQHVRNATAVRGPYDATADLARQAGIGKGDRVWILDEHDRFRLLRAEL